MVMTADTLLAAFSMCLNCACQTSKYDEGVLYDAQSIDGICIASPVLVYIDLLELKGRGEEAAHAILDKVIKRSW